MVVHAQISDMEKIMDIYAQARAFMRKTGNKHQWNGSYPAKEDILDDIANNNLYILKRGDKICGVFYFAKGPDITYNKIVNGNWISNEPYYVIHRIASATDERGVFCECLDFCLTKTNHIRIDTHKDNAVMQHVLKKNSFKECGIIYLLNMEERIAFEYIKNS